MAARRISVILEEWRRLEREHAAATSDAVRTSLAADIAALRAEHAAALTHQDAKADELESEPQADLPALIHASHSGQ